MHEDDQDMERSQHSVRTLPPEEIKITRRITRSMSRKRELLSVNNEDYSDGKALACKRRPTPVARRQRKPSIFSHYSSPARTRSRNNQRRNRSVATNNTIYDLARIEMEKSSKERLRIKLIKSKNQKGDKRKIGRILKNKTINKRKKPKISSKSNMNKRTKDNCDIKMDDRGEPKKRSKHRVLEKNSNKI